LTSDFADAIIGVSVKLCAYTKAAAALISAGKDEHGE
jgi:hypothetical protein